MSESNRYTVTLQCRVTDRRAAIRAARDAVQSNGGKRGEIRSARDAVHWLLDPGGVTLIERGVEVEGSRIETVVSVC